MRKKFRDLVAVTMSPAAQRRAHQLAGDALAEMELAELREALQIRQEELAKKLKVTQATISRLERRPNVLIETVSNYVKALGGELELRAVLPNQTVRLTHLLGAAEKKPQRRAPRKRRHGAYAASAT
jgi:transcriptional regulator with XRE-family HTH domain